MKTNRTILVLPLFVSLCWALAAPAGAASFALGATTLVEGPAAGSNSVLLAVSPSDVAWTATANATWLHLAAPSGTGSTNVAFGFDANTGATRTGTLTIAGLTLTVTQAGSSYVGANPLVTLVSSGLSSPSGVAVDASGNLYIADAGNSAVRKWIVTNQTVSTLVASELNAPAGVAADASGNLYIADTANNAIKKWDASSLTTLVSSGLNGPLGLAVDAAGNVYIADTVNNFIKRWNAADSTVDSLFSASAPAGVAVDISGDAYGASTGDGTILKRYGTDGSTSTVASGLGAPYGLAVDGTGSLYYSETNSSRLGLWCAVSNQVFSLATSGLTAPRGVAVDGARNVYIADAGANAILERPRAFVDPTSVTVAWNAGRGTLPAVLPTTQNLAGPFTPISDQWWLTITGVTNGVVSFNLATNTLFLSRTAHIALLGQTVTITQESTCALSATVLEEGPAAGIDQVSFQTESSSAWTATASAAWLHVLNPGGTGSGAVSFVFEENTGPERTAILTIAGATLKVLQRTTNWSGTPVSTLAATGVGGSGATLNGTVNPNVAGTGTFFEYSTNGGWLVSTIAAAGLDYCSSREDLAKDSKGCFYVCKPDCNELDIAYPTNGTYLYKIMPHPYYWYGCSSMVIDGDYGYVAADWCVYRCDLETARNWAYDTNTDLALKAPAPTWVLWAGDCSVTQQSVDGVGTDARFRSILGMVRDAQGDLYLGCMYNIRKIIWTNVMALTVTDQGTAADPPRDGPCKSADPTKVAIINGATGMALDDFGNLYLTERGMWNGFYIQRLSPTATNCVNCTITTVAGAGTTGCTDGTGSEATFRWPCNLVADKGGNLYVGDQCAVRKITQDGIVTTLVLRDADTGADLTHRLWLGLTKDGDGNFMVINSGSGSIQRIAYGLAAPVASATAQENLPQTGAAINISQTIAGLLPGTTYFYRAVVTNSLGTNHGEILSFTTPMPVLLTTNFVEGPATGTDSVALGTDPAMAWAATANAAWLHVTPSSGTGSANVHFTFDANSGAPRTGTVTVAYQTVTVIQAGSTYSRADFVGTLVAAGLSSPSGVAVDGSGNVYAADTAHNAIKKWNVSDGSVSTLLATGLNAPRGVAVDRLGNVYIADTGNNSVKKWNVAGGLVTTLRFPDGLNGPQGVAVDAHGNVYVADTGHGSIQEWIPDNGQVIPLVTSGLSAPAGVAVDAGGNVYIADTGHGMVKQWNVLNSNVTALVSSGLSAPAGVAVDGAGNVLIADTGNGAIKQWSVLDSSVTPVISSGLSSPAGVAVDGWGNVYIADAGNQAVKETPRAFVDTTARTTSPLAHCNTVMVVLPTLQNLAGPFIPTSDQSWLTVDGANNGLVSYSYEHNYGSARTGNINVLGRDFAVQQAGFDDQVTTNLVEGPAAATNYVMLAAGPSTAWTATANVDWLHVPVSAGTGGTNVTYTCDANSGATRTGTLTIAGQTVTVTQAGSTYTPALLRNLVSTGLNNPVSVAVDGAGDVYIADTGNHAIKKLNMADNTVSTLVSTGLSSPSGVAVDGAGNVYVADTGNGAIKRWNVTDNTVSTLVSTGLSSPKGLAVDRWGNVYIGDAGNGAIKWRSIDNGAVTVLVTNLNNPCSVAVDALGNVYFLDTYYAPKGNRLIKKWTEATRAVTILVYSGGGGDKDIRAVAVDGSGDVCSAESRREDIYIDYRTTYLVTNNLIWKWNSAAVYPPYYLGTKLITNGLSNPWGLAADNGGNLYIADTGSGTVKELPRAFVDATPRVAPPCAWVGQLPAVVPATQILSGPLAPTSDQPWLTITDVSGGVVTYSVTACPVAARTGHISLLGRSIAVTQTAASLGATNLTEGPAAGSDSVVVGVAAGVTWTATANAAWLHVPAGDRVGNANVVFTFDANTGATRSGTLTLNGQTLTVIQAGATYSAANPLTTLASTGLSAPAGVAVDPAGNVYIADSANNAVLKWKVADATVSTLVSSGLNHPAAVAVDGYANLYIADAGNNAIKRCGTGGGDVTTLISTGLNAPSAVAVDGWGNLYIADQGNQAVKRWDGLSGTVTTVVSTGLSAPSGVALDAAGNLYIADRGNNTLQEWVATSGTVTPLVSSGLNHPGGIAVDGSGNVWIADTDSQVIKKWSAIDRALTTVVASGLSSPGGVAVDTWGNLYIADTGHAAVKEVPRVFADFTARTEPGNAGTDALPTLVPAVQNLSGPFAPTSDAPWLTVAGVTNGVVSFRFSQNNNTAERTGNLTLLGRSIAVTQGYSTVLGALNLAEGTAAGTDSVTLAATSPSVAWTVTANASWLHAVTASGTGSSNVVFTFDANTGPVRSGTLTISDQLVTVVQGGPSYVAANPLTTLASAGLSGPSAVAVDSSGNIYVTDRTSGNTNAIKKWDLASNTMTTLVAEGSSKPSGVAVDAAGNVYFSESPYLKRWNVSDNTVTTLVSSGLAAPQGLAIDRWGYVYIADGDANAIKKFNPANSSLTTVISGLSSPSRVAVDVAGNLYVAESSAVKKWHAANSNLTTLVSVPDYVFGVAVDGSGNVYLAENNPYNLVTNLGLYVVSLSVIKKWSASDSTVSTLISSEGNTVYGLAVDGLGNLYFAGTNQLGTNFLQELPRAFVDTAPKIEPATAGTDSLSAVLPEAQNLSGPFTPASDQPWLTIAGAVNGVVSFDFSLSTLGRTRTAHISLLGQSIAVHQGTSAAYAVGLGTTNRVEGPAAGTDSVVLAIPSGTAWTATANDSWLHLTTDGGTGASNVLFSFDANPGATRTGTLTIAGQTLTVTQAGSPYVAATLLTNLVSSGLNGPDGVAVDGSGNVYFADTANNQLKQWRVADGSVSTLISSGLNAPRGVAVDAVGNVLIADTGNNEVKRWNAFDGSVSSVVSGLNAPRGVAVDAYNNLFIADTGNNKIWKWNAAVGTPTEVASSGLSAPAGVAADLAGNVYITDSGSGTVKRWDANSGTVTELCSGFNQPGGVAVDGSGNLYISDMGNGAIQKWSAVDGTVTALVSSGLIAPGGVAVDDAGSVYVADTGDNSVQEIPRAFVDVTAKTEPTFAGTGTLPVVLPTTQNLSGPLAATSDQPWLTILGATNGVVHFHREVISGYGRTAHVSLLGRSIAVTQAAGALGAASLVVGPAAGCDSITLAAAPDAAWTATANADWLHVTTASGAGDTNVVFTFDANLGATRTGTLTIADQTLTVTQAAATYSPASTFMSIGVTSKYSFGVDSSGNIYLGGTMGFVQRWNVTNNTVTPLCPDPSVMAELRSPRTVVVDSAGIVYFTDICGSGFYPMLRKWDPASGVVSNLGINPPSVLAVTASGDLYLNGNPTNAIQRWDCLSGAFSTVATNSGSFSGLAVDIAGNVYGADASADAIKKWNPGSSTLTTLIAPVLNAPQSVAVDGSGNVWLVGTNSLKKWKAADHTLTTLAFPVWNGVSRAVVDRAGNVYCADASQWAINVLPRAFVDTAVKTESAAAGSDTLSAVLPSTQNLSGPFAPTNDQPWLTITGVTNGVVSFSFEANTGAVRTAHISLLGTNVTITQAPPNRAPVASPMTVAAPRGLSLKIALSDLATHFSDPDGDAVRLVGLSTTSTNNRTLAWLNVKQNGDGSYVITNTAFIGYTNVTGTDAFGYTIADPLGLTAAGTVVILASADPLVGQSTGIVYPGGGPVTLRFAGIPGFTYQVQRTTDIADPASWTTIWTTNAPQGGLFQFIDDFGLSSPPASAYYRLSWTP